MIALDDIEEWSIYFEIIKNLKFPKSPEIQIFQKNPKFQKVKQVKFQKRQKFQKIQNFKKSNISKKKKNQT